MTITRSPAARPEPTAAAACSSIDQLLQDHTRLWRGCDMAGQGNHGHPTGFAGLDEILPGRGWPHHGTMEIISPRWGMGELQLLMPLMRSMTEQGKWILWIAPPYQLYAPALAQAGIDVNQILLISPDTPCKEGLWAMEKALQTENCGLVLAWQNWLPGKVLRRLQLAAETGKTLGVLFKHKDSKHSPSPMKLKIQGFSTSKQCFNEAEVQLLKARGNFQPLSTRLRLYPATWVQAK